MLNHGWSMGRERIKCEETVDRLHTTCMLSVIDRFKQSIAHEYKDDTLVCSSKNKIFLINDLEKPEPLFVGEIPWHHWQKVSHVRLLDRILKNSIRLVHRTNNTQYIVATKSHWWLIDKASNATLLKDLSGIQTTQRGICESKKGVVYIGEYGLNLSRNKPIRIFSSRDSKTFKVAWEFPKKSIRHIHAVIPDIEYDNRIWVLTGDLDHESHFYYSDDDFKTVNKWLSAGQVSRSIDIVQHNGELFWGMDSPDEKAFIIRSTRKSPNEYERIFELPGPAYYSTSNENGGIYLGTTVEPGDEVKDDYAHIFSLQKSGAWKRVVTCKNDMVPQYGIFYLPIGKLPKNFVVYSQRALKPYEGYLTIAKDTMRDQA